MPRPPPAAIRAPLPLTGRALPLQSLADEALGLKCSTLLVCLNADRLNGNATVAMSRLDKLNIFKDLFRPESEVHESPLSIDCQEKREPYRKCLWDHHVSE